MSSAETPQDPNTPPPSDDETRKSLRLFIGWVIALAIIGLAILPLSNEWHDHHAARIANTLP